MGTHPIFESDFDCLTACYLIGREFSGSMSDSAMFLATLVEMGFDQGISKVALSKTGSTSVQSAMDWILANPDFVPDTSDVPESSSGETVPPSPLIGGDQDTPVVQAPERTPEEKAKAAKDLQERLDKAREIRIEKERQERIEKEKERREQGKAMGTMKESYEQMEMKRLAAQRKKEKAQAIKDKERVRQQIAEDKERRRLEAEKAKNSTSAAAVGETSELTQEIKAKVARPAATNTRLQIRFPDNSRRVQVFEADDKLSAVARFSKSNGGFESESDFDLIFQDRPPKKFGASDMELTL